MIRRGKSLWDVGRAAKKGAMGAMTSGLLDTTINTTGKRAAARAGVL
jgi:hypothetical protein